jgi:hypothetical protein
MSRLSRNQKRRRRELEEQMNHGLFPTTQNTLSTNQNTFPISGYRTSETTKETCYSLSDNQKQDRIYQREDRIWESSPLGEAALSQSALTKEGNRTDLVSTVRFIFPARQQLYSVDCLGRRSEIETGHLSEEGYLSLLNACKNPVRLDSPTDLSLANSPWEASREIPEGCKIGSETELPIPEWWELPEEGTTISEIEELIRRNLARVHKERTWTQREGKDILVKVGTFAPKVGTFGFSRVLSAVPSVGDAI